MRGRFRTRPHHAVSLATIILSLCNASCFVVGLGLVCGTSRLGASPPRIRSGEFPFKLTYSLRGRDIDVIDSLACRYEGQDCHGGDSVDDWSWSVSGGAEDLILLEMGDGSFLRFDFGHCRYMMGRVPESHAEGYTGTAVFLHHEIEGTTWETRVEAMELEDRYGIRILAWHIADPLDPSLNLIRP